MLFMADRNPLNCHISCLFKIVIIGGGAVGFELAGEIREKHKDKAVTIISSSEKLVCPDFAPKFYSRVNSLVEAANVKVTHSTSH